MSRLAPQRMCQHCGRRIRVKHWGITSTYNKKFCNKQCRVRHQHLSNHPHWKGGRQRTKDGYILISIGKGRVMFEHRLVIERSLGRKLRRGEVVHHRNHIRDDNRLENLQVMTPSEHTLHHALGRPPRPFVPRPTPNHIGQTWSDVHHAYRVYMVRRCCHCAQLFWGRKDYPAKRCSLRCSVATRKPSTCQYTHRTITTQGYVEVYVPTHFNVHRKGYALEHRVLMEQHLHRALKRSEPVYHLNGNKLDNRLENLSLTAPC